ncbi:uncharacterized protein V1518DRAFT_409583 [Limtongia smithiae]|uniref:uncharacterized protein n=1 Tax=Limtongia smithiae TaxID=1125753 RepID=UPI0034CEBB49
MDITFITIFDLTDNATILYASDSVSLVLGYEPAEVEMRSCFDFVNPPEVSRSRGLFQMLIATDRAAALEYVRLTRRDGSIANCEFVGSVVNDVIIAAVSVYQWTVKSEDRARLAPLIQRAFSHSVSSADSHHAQMLNHLNTKFDQIVPSIHEPRAALILDRASLSLPVLYATYSITEILDIGPDDIRGWDFWDCVDAEYLVSAQLAVERAKENDSIAYMRFQWRDPRSHNRPSTLNPPPHQQTDDKSVEVEVVVSCSSDGLVMVIRHAAPVSTPEQARFVDASARDVNPRAFRSVFASPWGAPTPILPPPLPKSYTTPCTTFPLVPINIPELHDPPDPPAENRQILGSIQDMAVFAWGLHSPPPPSTLLSNSSRDTQGGSPTDQQQQPQPPPPSPAPPQDQWRQ